MDNPIEANEPKIIYIRRAGWVQRATLTVPRSITPGQNRNELGCE